MILCQVTGKRESSRFVWRRFVLPFLCISTGTFMGCQSKTDAADAPPYPVLGDTSASHHIFDFKELLAPPNITPQAERTTVVELSSFAAKLETSVASSLPLFLPPSPRESAQFTQAVLAAFSGQESQARALFAAIGFPSAILRDSKTGEEYLFVRETLDPQKPSPQGSYFFRRGKSRGLVLEAPHAKTDRRTLVQSALLFQRTQAKAFFASGVGRCASSVISSCTQKPGTVTCDGFFRISDAAHSPATFFQAAHAATTKGTPRPVVISIHGYSYNKPGAVLSDGTRRPATPGTLVLQLTQRLKAAGMDVESCNAEGYSGQDGSDMCGEFNVQGRLSNGSTDPCHQEASGSSGGFVHIEQSPTMRADANALTQVLSDLVP